jgi:Short C-terminal domain
MAKAVEKAYGASAGRLYAALLRAVSELGYSISHSDATDRTVSFNTGLSMKSWGGQNMTATVFPLAEGDSKIVVGGRRHQNSPQVFDWGEKGKITGKLLEAIDRALPETPEPAQPTAPTGAASSGSTADELQRLGELKAQGVLTDDEFNAEKARILQS